MVERVTQSLTDPEVTLRGLSTDTKPTTKVNNNDVFHELDTGKLWVFSEHNINPVTSNGWWEV